MKKLSIIIGLATLICLPAFSALPFGVPLGAKKISAKKITIDYGIDAVGVYEQLNLPYNDAPRQFYYCVGNRVVAGAIAPAEYWEQQKFYSTTGNFPTVTVYYINL